MFNNLMHVYCAVSVLYIAYYMFNKLDTQYVEFIICYMYNMMYVYYVVFMICCV